MRAILERNDNAAIMANTNVAEAQENNRYLVYVNGKAGLYTEIVPDCKRLILQAVILGKVSIESVIYSDGCRGCNGLVDVGYSRHFRISHGVNEFARDGHCHINGSKSFWSFTKRRLAKLNGVSANFGLHLKESEWCRKKTA